MNVAFFLIPKSRVAYLTEGSSFRQGMEKLHRYGYTAIPVVSREGRYLGSVSEGDFLWNIMSMGSMDSRALESARIDDIISDRTPPVPVTASMEGLMERALEQLKGMADRLKEHIVGQDQAVEAVAKAIRRNRVGISPKRRPVSFIFVGPTGVGKTELVKCLANDLFDSVDSLIRLDMSEYMEKHTVSKLIGSPPGYVGYDEAGQLTEKIRRKPYSVVLFDEIEKAHPDVLNVLLQVLDDGRITDAQGRAVNFENTIIVMTSNAGSEGRVGGLGFGRTENDMVKERTMKALREFLRPEFINRVDEIISFNHLSREDFLGIADIMLGELRASLSSRGLSLDWDDGLRQYLADEAYSVTYGARNLRRTIQRKLEDPISEAIIDSFESPISSIGIRVEEGNVRLDIQ